MGVEFKLGRQDHKKVEDFLGRRPTGVDAITIDVNHASYQASAADEAKAMGIDVLIDPLTERLADIGFEPDGLEYFTPGEPIDTDLLRTDWAACRQFVRQVLDAQRPLATKLIPPHFYVHDPASARLNIRLARMAVELADGMPVRPVLLVSRQFAVANLDRFAANYRGLDEVTEVELRVTPFGGDDESAGKIRSVFGIADAFREGDLDVVLGYSGNIGQTALALNHVTGFSLGIGMREHVNHASTINRQVRALDETDDDNNHFGAHAGVYLPGPAATVNRTTGAAMLADTTIRTRIGCRIGKCANGINGPAADPRDHYLHAKAYEVAELIGTPAPWRANTEHGRLGRALMLRELINAGHIPPGAYTLKTRTVRGLLEGIDYEQRLSA